MEFLCRADGPAPSYREAAAFPAIASALGNPFPVEHKPVDPSCCLFLLTDVKTAAPDKIGSGRFDPQQEANRWTKGRAILSGAYRLSLCPTPLSVDRRYFPVEKKSITARKPGQGGGRGSSVDLFFPPHCHAAHAAGEDGFPDPRGVEEGVLEQLAP